MDMKEFGALIQEVSHKIDWMKEDLSGIKQTQTAQAKDIEHHIRRIDLLEERMEKTVGEIKPLAEQRTKMQGMYALLLFISLIVGIGVGLARLEGVIRDIKTIRGTDK